MKKLLIYTVLLFNSFTFYAQVQSYYNGLDLTKTELDLFYELSERLKTTHSGIPYTGSTTDVWDACKLADVDPNITGNVLLIYGFNDVDGIISTDRTRNNSLQDTGGGSSKVWNREHVFPKSLANPIFGTDEPSPGTDVHNLRPADKSRNSERSNRKFAEGSGEASYITANGGWYPGDEWKGDVARIIMYMYTRYNGDGSQSTETNCFPNNVGIGEILDIDSKMVDLFLKWNVDDPVSDFETNRNEVLAGIQGNRNPFIDNPYLATLIWGGLVAEDKWNMNGSSDAVNPSTPLNLNSSLISFESFELNWSASTDNVGVYDYLIYVNGVYYQTATTTTAIIANLISDTTYQITVKARDNSSNFSAESSVLEVKTLIGPKILLEENFNDCNNISFFSFNEDSNKNWECQTQFGENNSGSMAINGYQQNTSSKDWLITNNPVNLDEFTGELLSFYTDAAYGDTTLELLFSSDFNKAGNPSDFTWNSVPNVTIPTHSSGSGSEEVFTFSNIDISELTGEVYFAFKYYSSAEPTRWTVDSFKIIADNDDNPDVDGDGVLNENDACSNTPIGDIVDANGCSYNQLDEDEDGITNGNDLCDNTPIGEDVNTSGCAESQLDEDEDGIMNNLDQCSNTPAGEFVNENGCSYNQLDDDEDGILNGVDLCLNTPIGEIVNDKGCAESQLDDDNDSVMNDVDLCSNTQAGEDVNTSGCSESQLDDDNDGVMNNIDQCPNTTAGVPINAVGCFTLPSNNFTIETLSETCSGKENGEIKITAQNTNYNYLVTINGNEYNFNEIKTIGGLAPKDYEFCISVEGENYQQCFTVTIAEGNEISGKTSVSSNKTFVTIDRGTAPFTISVNGINKFTTIDSSFNIESKHGDLIEVKTAVSCEGVLAQKVEVEQNIIAFPNPTKGNFEIAIPFILINKKVKVEVYNVNSQLVTSNEMLIVNGKVKVDINNQPLGVYLLKVKLPNQPAIVIKLVKN